MEQLSMREIELLEEQKKWRYETRDTLKDSKEIFDLLCHLEDFSVQYYELKNTINEAIEYNEHLIRDAKYHLNLGHLKKMKKILKGDKE